MTRINDDDIAAEDGPSIGAPRTREEWDQTFRALDEADRIPSLPSPPVLSMMRDLVGDCLAPVRVFHPSRDLPAALDEGQLTRAAWGDMNVGHPVVVAALGIAENAETLRHVHGALYRCDACLETGGLETFPWAGALFVHLLTCPHFAKTVE